MIKRVSVVGIKIHQLQERGKIPGDIKWVGTIPPSYSLSFVTNTDNQDETLIVVSDGFGGGIAWARVMQAVDIIGKELEITRDEKDYLREKYPSLATAIESL